MATTKKAIEHSNNFLYNKCLLEMKVVLLPMEIGENQTKANLASIIKSHIEGKCIREGYVRPNSVNIRTYSSGTIKGEYVEFTVVFECYACYPAEGSVLVDCLVKSVTKAGIHCNVTDENGNVPVTVFIARDHFVEKQAFNDITEEHVGKTIDVKIIGTRFELNDECVEAVGSIYTKKA
jgi:DNA-directed RNA polymerase subunit E'/Rpb7